MWPGSFPRRSNATCCLSRHAYAAVPSRRTPNGSPSPRPRDRSLLAPLDASAVTVAITVFVDDVVAFALIDPVVRLLIQYEVSMMKGSKGSCRHCVPFKFPQQNFLSQYPVFAFSIGSTASVSAVMVLSLVSKMAFINVWTAKVTWRGKGRCLTVSASLRAEFAAPGRIGTGWSLHDAAQRQPAVAVGQAAARGRTTMRFILICLVAGKITGGRVAVRPVTLSLAAIAVVVLSIDKRYDSDQRGCKADEV